MKEVIEAILKEEKTARERVEKAREDAKNIRLKAEGEAKQLVLNAQEEAQAEARALIETVRADAEKDKDAAMFRAAEAGESLWKDKTEQIRGTVDRLFQLITGKTQ